MLTPDGVISRYLYGVDYPARDFRWRSSRRAAAGSGPRSTRCCSPATGTIPANRRYAPFVFGFMRIGAGLVFLALAGLLTVLWRKELAMKRRRARVAATNGRTA